MKGIIFFSLLLLLFSLFGCVFDNSINVSSKNLCSDRNYYEGCAVPSLAKSTYFLDTVTSLNKCTAIDGEVIYRVQYGGGSGRADVPYFYFNQDNEFMTRCGGLPDTCSFPERIGDINKCNNYCNSLQEDVETIDSCLSNCANCLPKKIDPCDTICEKFPGCCY